MDFSIVIPRMRGAIQEYLEKCRAQGRTLGEREAIVQWMERYYDNWFQTQAGLAAIPEPPSRPAVSPQEKRRHPRLPIEITAFYRVLWTPQEERASAPAAGETADIKNISVGGLYIVTGRPYPVSTLLEIQFDLPGASQSISAFAMVVWREERSVGRYGHGVHFSHIETSHSDLINDAIMERLLDAPVVAVTNGDNRG